jgi:hypothetical protein
MMLQEIERIRSSTDIALDALLAGHVPGRKEEMKMPRTLEEARAEMAQSHERKVKALIENFGRERAISLGREALFRTGLELGREAKTRLAVKDSKNDLFRAARVLYLILGIEFNIVVGPEGERMEVFRCPLSQHYSQVTCMIMSAVDEGTFSGLNPHVGLSFKEHITDGASKCVAIIDLKVER